MKSTTSKKGTAVSGTFLTIQQTIRRLSTVFSSKNFAATVQCYGVDPDTGKDFAFNFIFSNEDPEFMKLLNDYGARKSVELITSVQQNFKNTHKSNKAI